MKNLNMPPPLDRTSTGCSSPPATDFPDGDHGVDRAGVGRTDVGGHKDGCQAGGNVLPHRGGKVGRVQSVPVVLSRPISPSSWDQPNVSPEPGNVGCFLHGGMRLGLRRKHERCIRAASVQRAIGQGGRQDRCQRPRERVLLHKPFSGRRNNVGRGRVSGSAVRQSAVSALAKLFDTPSNNLGGSGTIKTADKKGGGREGEDHT